MLNNLMSKVRISGFIPLFPIGLGGLERDNRVKCSSSMFCVLPEKQPLLMHSASQVHRWLDY